MFDCVSTAINSKDVPMTENAEPKKAKSNVKCFIYVILVRDLHNISMLMKSGTIKLKKSLRKDESLGSIH